MLTLRQALQLPEFAKARVVAGAAGLDQYIRRVHTVDIPDSKFTWGRGALLLTAGYGLKDSPERQAALVPTLVANGLVGVVFSTGWYHEDVPAAIVSAGEAHNFPVVALPPEVEFVGITERLYVEIVNYQFALKERAADIHNRLTGIVLEGGDLSDVAAALAGIVGRSILIESPDHEVLASAEIGPIDENRRATIEAGRTPAENVQHLQECGFYPALHEEMRAMRLSAIPELGMTMERVVAPVNVGREIYGYVWIVAGERPLDDLDELALGHAATVAALILVKEQAVYEAQQALRGDFLAELLRMDGPPDDRVRERGRMLGYHFDRSHQALFVRGPDVNGATQSRWAARLDGWLRGQGVWALVVPREEGIAVIVESRSDATGESLAAALVAEHKFVLEPHTVGVSRMHGREALIRAAYRQAREAAAIGRRLGGAERVLCFWNLGLLHWLYHLPPDVVSSNPYVSQVQALFEHDARQRGDLLDTLEMYLEHGGALADAAATLNVHRNTLLYRLGRIEEVAGVDLRDASQRHNLFAALKAFRLGNEPD
ncbi:MAG: PucR family transcriptional regulator [Anaerolineales bacterium]